MEKNKRIKVMFYGMRDYEISAMEPVAKAANLDYKFLPYNLNKDTAVFAFGCDAVCIFVEDDASAPVIDELVEAGVQLIAIRGAGYNNVDLTSARGRIDVVRVPAYSPHAIAEFAMAMLLAVNRNIHKSYSRTRDYNFSLGGLLGFDLFGKTAGVVGEGEIGRCFIDICKGFGMKVLVCTPHPHHQEGIEYVSFEEMCGRSDIISLHCPLTKENHHLINKETISLMKPNVILVNTSRGGLIDTADLIEALKQKRIKAAALDVYEKESGLFFDDYSEKVMADDTLSRLIGFPNVLVTSHQAFFTEEAINAIAQITIDNIVQYIDTGNCENIVK